MNIYNELLAEAKAFAVCQRLTFTRLIEEGLRLRVRAGEPPPTRKRRPMPAFRGRGGMALGLSGLSTRELLDAADDAA